MGVSPREIAMPKQQIRSDKLRQPSGVFSHATMIEASGRLVFISGMTARRADGSIAGIGDIAAQTRQVCENVKAAVEAAGGTMDDICRVDVYIRNMEQFDAIHKVRREYFREPLPASTMVEVVKMTHPDTLSKSTRSPCFLKTQNSSTDRLARRRREFPRSLRPDRPALQLSERRLTLRQPNKGIQTKEFIDGNAW